MRLLFVTWDGPQVSYVEGLFAPILAGLASRGVRSHILQFRWGGREAAARTAVAVRAHGLGYTAAPVLRTLGGAGAFVSAVAGALAVRRAAARTRADVIMPRSLLPALSVLLARTRARTVFDADGLLADERAEFDGLPTTGAVYGVLRAIEAQAVRRSAAVLVRSPTAAAVLDARAGPGHADRFHIVANGRDAMLFAPGSAADRAATRAALGIDAAAPLLVYAGSIGRQYRLADMAALVAEVRARLPATRLLVLSGDPDGAAAELAPHLPGFELFARVQRAAPGDVPALLAAADVGLAYRSPGYSMRAVAPVKLAEYLLCGLPVVGTAAIGDTGAALAAGVFHDEATGAEAAARWIIESALPGRDRMRARAREVGVTGFSLERGIADYARALGLDASPPASPALP